MLMVLVLPRLKMSMLTGTIPARKSQTTLSEEYSTRPVSVIGSALGNVFGDTCSKVA